MENTENKTVEAIDEVEVSAFKKFGDKVMDLGKKHGKKIALLAGAASIGAIGYLIGKKSNVVNLIDMDVVEDVVDNVVDFVEE